MTTRSERRKQERRAQLDAELPGFTQTLDKLAAREAADAAAVLEGIGGPKMAAATFQNIRSHRQSELRSHGSKRRY